MSNIDADAVTKAIEQFSTDADLAHIFVQGGDEETVVLGGKATPTLRNLAKNIGKQSLDQVLAQGVAEITAIKNQTQTLYEQTEDVLPQIEAAKETAVEGVLAQENTSEQAVQAQATTSIGQVQQEGNAQVARIEQIAGKALPLGLIVPATCTAAYVPFGMLPCNGATYTEAQFVHVVEYIEQGFLPWKTFTEYQAALDSAGKTPYFAWDTPSRTFRVPFIPDGSFIQQAQSDEELGKTYEAGLPNITGTVGEGNSTNGLIRNTSAYPTLATGAFTALPKTGAGRANSTESPSSNISFDASRSSSIYGNSSTVQPQAIALRHFVVVATEMAFQSVADWSAAATNPLGTNYACIINGESTGAPHEVQDSNLGTNGNIYEGSRFVLENPFGNNTPVMVVAEVFSYDHVWADACWYTETKTNGTVESYGTKASYVQGVGIVVQTGSNSVMGPSALSGSGHNLNFDQNNGLCRVHVWKI